MLRCINVHWKINKTCQQPSCFTFLHSNKWAKPEHESKSHVSSFSCWLAVWEHGCGHLLSLMYIQNSFLWFHLLFKIFSYLISLHRVSLDGFEFRFKQKTLKIKYNYSSKWMFLPLWESFMNSLCESRRFCFWNDQTPVLPKPSEKLHIQINPHQTKIWRNLTLWFT